jgi:hypothetical protein
MSVTLKSSLDKLFCCNKGRGLFHDPFDSIFLKKCITKIYTFYNAGISFFVRIQPTSSSENAVRSDQSTVPTLNINFGRNSNLTNSSSLD